jgi:hypothetical protein
MKSLPISSNLSKNLSERTLNLSKTCPMPKPSLRRLSLSLPRRTSGSMTSATSRMTFRRST